MTKYQFGPDTMTAPWGLDSRLKLVVLACGFFDVNNVITSHEVIGKSPTNPESPPPLSVTDFLDYLETMNAFTKTPSALRVARIVEEMVSAGLLVPVGRVKPSFAGFDNCYFYVPTVERLRRGPFGLAPVLGPEYLFRLCEPILAHISGRNDDGAVAGTGLVVDARHVLTCGHVISDMALDRKQVFQGKQYMINDDSVHGHPDIDIAVIRVDGPALSAAPGLFLQTPVVAQTVFTLGYPKLPGLQEASVTMQRGAVTNESVTSLAGDRLFLYSAIARPGNSGGPVMSEDGYIVGLCVVDATGHYHNEDVFSQHYAGIPAQVIVQAVEDLNLGFRLPFEDYE